MTTRRVLALALALVVAVGIGAMWFFSDTRVETRHRATWESRKPDAYSFDWSYCSGMCGGCSLTVTVEHDEVVGTRGECSDGRAVTIDEVFEMLSEQRTYETTDSVDVDYDDEWGFPARVSVRCPDGYTDCGTSFGVRDFQPLDE